MTSAERMCNVCKHSSGSYTAQNKCIIITNSHYILTNQVYRKDYSHYETHRQTTETGRESNLIRTEEFLPKGFREISRPKEESGIIEAK